jgi:hypothetical protein
MNLAVLASHEGTTLQSLIDAFAHGHIPGRVSVVVSNNGDSGALVKARQAGVQAVHLSSSTHPDPATLDAAIREVLVAADVDVVFLAGFMKKLGPFVLGTFQGRILNTHPALLPRFGGLGCTGIVCSSRCLRPARRNLACRFISLIASTTAARSCVSAGFRSSGMTRSTISKLACVHERRSSWSKRLQQSPSVTFVSAQRLANVNP